MKYILALVLTTLLSACAMQAEQPSAMKTGNSPMTMDMEGGCKCCKEMKKGEPCCCKSMKKGGGKMCDMMEGKTTTSMKAPAFTPHPATK